jgi:hypothetical protein
MVKCEEVIITDQKRRGDGKAEGTPIRSVTQVFAKDGKLLAEQDDLGSYTAEDMGSFYRSMLNFIREYPEQADSTTPMQAIEYWKSNKATV